MLLGGAWTVHAAGQVAVSDGGAAAYSYPLAVPPGIAGMAPKLSLSYSGNGINGPVGLGWSVQGLSAITRCPATIATDGVNSVNRGVSFGPTDKLCLDGQRLIQSDANNTPLGTQTDDARGLATGSREFRTEKDSYARIRAYGIANGADTNGPAYFKVWTKSGQIYEYGAAPSADANTRALINAQGKSVAAVWAVARISDTVGNYIDFKYEQRDVTWGSGPTAAGAPGHEWNISEIQYTGSAGQAPSNKVVFSYIDRPESRDRAEAYHQGSKNVSVRLLQAVRTYVNSSNPTGLGPAAGAIKVKTTKLDYISGPITGRSLVNSITECAGSVESPCLPATTFAYAPGGNDAYVVNTNFSNSSLSTLLMIGPYGNYGVIPGDFDGDGKTDIIRWSDDPGGNRLYLSNGDGGFTTKPLFNITDQNLFKSDSCYISMVADFNGDGISDILRYGCGAGPTYLYFSLGSVDGTFNRVPITTPSLLLQTSKFYYNCLVAPGPGGSCAEPGDREGRTSGSTYYLLDVDGDGILDIVTAYLPGYAPIQMGDPPPDGCLTQVCTRVYKGNGDGTFAEIPTNVAHKSLYRAPNSSYTLGNPSDTVDVDGDGLTDIIGWRSRGDGNFDLLSATACGYPMDFNGDGRSDCVIPNNGGAAYNRLIYADGTGATPTVGGFNLTNPGQELSVFNTSTFTNAAGIVVGDFNGDGRQDILRWKDDPASNALYLSNGDGTFTQSGSFSLPAGSNNLKSSDTSNPTDFTLGDFTGRGAVEILRLRHAGGFNSNRLLVKADPTPPDQLSSVTSSTGLTTRLTYAPLTNSGGRYTSDRDAANTRIYPKVHLAIPNYVVTTSTTDTGVGTGTISTDYSYFGLKANYLGRGLLGFREIHRQAPGSNGENLTVMTQYLQDYPYIGVASRTDTRRGTLNDAGAPLLSSSTFVYCDQTAAAGAEASATLTAPCTTNSLVQRPYLYKSVETGSDLSGAALPTVTTTNAFNGSGDPRSITVTTTATVAGSVNQTFTKTTTNTYFPDNIAGDTWIRGRLQKATVQNTVPNSLGAIATSAGTAANATATTGTRSALPVTISPTAVTQSRPDAGTISGTATVSVGDYPTPPINYSWTRVPPSSTAFVSASPASGTSNSVTLSATLGQGQTASETFQVTVTDAAGRTGSATVPVSFSVTTDPLSITVSPSAPSASRNNPGAISTTATVTPSGGQAPITYSWTRLSGSRITVTNATSPTATFSATLGWSENLQESFQVAVTDSVGQLRTASVTVTFTSPPEPTVGVNPNPLAISSATNGGTASGSVTATGAGGVPPYSYNWVQTGGNGITVANTTTATPSFSSVVSYGSSASATYQVTLTDAAGNTATSQLTVNATGPAWPPASITLSPTSYGYGSVRDMVVVTATFTVTNSGGPGTLTATVTPTNGGFYSIGARTCPANGASMAGLTSCTIDVSYQGNLQCGGSVIQRPATFTVTVGSSTATAALTAANYVYSPTSPQCR